MAARLAGQQSPVPPHGGQRDQRHLHLQAVFAARITMPAAVRSAHVYAVALLSIAPAIEGVHQRHLPICSLQPLARNSHVMHAIGWQSVHTIRYECTPSSVVPPSCCVAWVCVVHGAEPHSLSTLPVGWHNTNSDFECISCSSSRCQSNMLYSRGTIMGPGAASAAAGGARGG